VPLVRRTLTLAAGLAAGAIGGVLLRRRRVAGGRAPGGRDPRAEELRRKLSQARDAAADEEELDAAGMGGETVAVDQPPARPTREEADSLRRRTHERGRDTADEMRRVGDGE
jgi:hypothetical protein